MARRIKDGELPTTRKASSCWRRVSLCRRERLESWCARTARSNSCLFKVRSVAIWGQRPQSPTCTTSPSESLSRSGRGRRGYKRYPRSDSMPELHPRHDTCNVQRA